MSDRTKSGDEAEDEENILYVAMTRAKEYLVIFFFLTWLSKFLVFQNCQLFKIITFFGLKMEIGQNQV